VIHITNEILTCHAGAVIMILLWNRRNNF